MQMQGKDTKVSVPSECAVIDVLARADGVIASHLKSSSTWSGLGVCVGCVECGVECVYLRFYCRAFHPMTQAAKQFYDIDNTLSNTHTALRNTQSWV